MRLALRLLAAGLAGYLLALAYEPVAFAYVIPVSLAVFGVVTRGVRMRTGFVLGLVFGTAFYAVHIRWMAPSIGSDAWAALSGIEAAFYGLLGAAAAVIHRLRAWPFWLACAWTAMETVRSTWPFSGMPWGRLGFAVVDTPWAPALAYVGVTGVSLLLAAIGFLAARVVVSPSRMDGRWAATGLIAVTALTALPAMAPWSLGSSGEITVAAVQGDVPGPGNDILADYRGVTQNHVDATIELAARVRAGDVAPPRFVLWPENSTAVDPFNDYSTGEQIEAAVSAIDVPLVVGAIVDAGEEHVLNQGIVWDPVTGAGDRYTKQNPVPYGEYIPFRKQLSGLFGRLDRIPRDMLSGTRRTPLDVAGVPVADAICFDIAYDAGLADQIERGGELLAVQTSNASFIFTDQVEQQFAITRARAIETGKYVVVASTNGVSGVIAPDGAVVARTERRTQDVLVESVELRPGVTPGLRVGAALALGTPLAAGLAVLLGLVVGWRARRLSRRSTAEEVS